MSRLYGHPVATIDIDTEPSDAIAAEPLGVFSSFNCPHPCLCAHSSSIPINPFTFLGVSLDLIPRSVALVASIPKMEPLQTCENSKGLSKEKRTLVGVWRTLLKWEFSKIKALRPVAVPGVRCCHPPRVCRVPVATLTGILYGPIQGLASQETFTEYPHFS